MKAGVLRSLVVLIAVVFLSAAGSAHAAVTVFPSNVFSQTGPVTSAANALGAPDGTGAVIGVSGEVVLEFSQWLSGQNVTLTTITAGIIEGGSISIGHVVGGVAVFSAETPFTRFIANTYNFDLSTQCAGISANGCSLIRLRTTGAFLSPGISLDGVASSAPEPGTWALMLLAFVMVAARMKQMRKSQSDLGPIQRPPSFQPC